MRFDWEESEYADGYLIEVTGVTTVGTLVCSVKPGAAVDGGGNPNEASTSADNSVNFDPIMAAVAPMFLVFGDQDVDDGMTAALTVTVAGLLVPVTSPLQLAKVQPGSADAVSVTTSPGSKRSWSGSLITEPSPSPIAMGVRPRMVVMAVMSTGRSRRSGRRPPRVRRLPPSPRP